jgi:hypothetical protein
VQTGELRGGSLQRHRAHGATVAILNVESREVLTRRRRVDFSRAARGRPAGDARDSRLPRSFRCPRGRDSRGSAECPAAPCVNPWTMEHGQNTDTRTTSWLPAVGGSFWFGDCAARLIPADPPKIPTPA